MSKLAKSEISKNMRFILPDLVILIWCKSNCASEHSKRPLDVIKKFRNPDLNRIYNEKCQILTRRVRVFVSLGTVAKVRDPR